MDKRFYWDYLARQGDKDVNITPWQKIAPNKLCRHIDTSHKLKIRVPGTPSHARTHLVQTATLSNRVGIQIFEETTFSDIPYANYFDVATKWIVMERSSSGIVYDEEDAIGTGLSSSPKHCAIEVTTEVRFSKATWLKGTISSNTVSECRETLALWAEFALELASTVRIMSSTASDSNSSDDWFAPANPPLLPSPGDNIAKRSISGMIDESHASLSSSQPLPLSMSGTALDIGESRSSSLSDNISSEMEGQPTKDIHSCIDPALLPREHSFGNRTVSSVSVSDDDEYFDVEVDDSVVSDVIVRPPSWSSMQVRAALNRRVRSSFDNSYQSSRRNVHSQVYSGVLSSPPGQTFHRSLDDSSVGAAQLLKEAFVVIINFLWWRLRSFSLSELAVYLVPSPHSVLRRLGWAIVMVPSCDFGAIKDSVCAIPIATSKSHPHQQRQSNDNRKVLGGTNIDLYTPIILVFTHAQILLWCIDIAGTNHQHCRREILLGVSIAVSLSSWVGTSLFYRLITYLFLGTPGVSFVESLCISGYGIIGSCTALVSCQLLVLFSHLSGLHISHEIPLSVFGISSGASLGWSFIASRPIQSSVLVLSSISNQRSTPCDNNGNGIGGGSDGADRESKNGITRSAKALLAGAVKNVSWSWSRIICFAIIITTHYEILRYIYHAVIPGQQTACNTFAVLSPADVAKFLSNPKNMMPNIIS